MRKKRGRLAPLTMQDRKTKAARNERRHRAAKLWAKRTVVEEKVDPITRLRKRREAKRAEEAARLMEAAKRLAKEAAS